jgi:hypothetical protein
MEKHVYFSQLENARDVVDLHEEGKHFYGREISLEHLTPATVTESWDFVAVGEDAGDAEDNDDTHVSMEVVLTGRPHCSMIVLEGFIDIQTVDAIDPSLLDLGTNVLCRHWHRTYFPNRMSLQLATDLWEFLRHESSELSRVVDVFRPLADWSGTFAPVDLGGDTWNWIRFVAPLTLQKQGCSFRRGGPAWSST